MNTGKIDDTGSAAPVWVTAALSLSALLASLGTSIANIALPTLTQAFAAPFAEVQAVVVSYLAALTVSVVVAGRLGDRFGLRRVLLAGLGLFAISSLACAIAPGLVLLIGARVGQGIGAAILMTLAMALMRELASEAQVGRAMGLLGTVSALGTALGPSLGGLLLPLAGWRGIFAVQVPLALIALLLVAILLPTDAPKPKAKAPSLLSVMDRRLLPNLVINVLVAAVMMTTLVVGPFFLALSLGLDPASVGLVMTVGPVISILGGVPAGRLVDGWGSGRVLRLGLGLLFLGTLLLAVLPGFAGVAGYIVAISLLTPGYQLFQAANNTLVLADISKALRGTVSGLLSLSRNAGLIAGASLMGAVFACGVGRADIASASADAISDGMRVTFLLAGALMLFALLLEVAFGRKAA
ncbi:MFS family permease [Rhizobium aquaticum]|uniref:MFS family permease n=1 Tax=Rhizobium aquaticum TaxID=1549636 RepID=A0ABV2J1L8_9HYPH